MNHRLYTTLAPWWPMLAQRESLFDEAKHILSLFDEACGKRANSLLELGCGGGGIASHFDHEREVVLTDISEDMLNVCRQQNPGRECLNGDMLTLRLNRTFDAVLLHDAVMYLTTEAELQAAFATAAAHLESGGIFLVVPDVLKDGFEERAVSGGIVGRPGVQIMEWHWDPNPEDDTHQLDVAVLYRDEDGAMQSIHEHHTLGLFSAETLFRCMVNAGLAPVADLIWDENLMPEVLAARKP